MSDAPEEMSMWVDVRNDTLSQKVSVNRVKYVRADLYEAALAREEKLREAHEENARILGYLENELQGRVEAGKLAALSKCVDRSRAALSDQHPARDEGDGDQETK